MKDANFICGCRFDGHLMHWCTLHAKAEIMFDALRQRVHGKPVNGAMEKRIVELVEKYFEEREREVKNE